MSSEVSLIPAQKRDLVLSPVMDLTLAKSRMEEFQQFVQYYLEPSADGGQDGGDYGPIPGAGKKKVLLKSGADKLTELYGLYDEYEIDAREDFDTKLFYYKIKCFLKSRRDDSLVGTGLGSCSTWESKYRWRDSQRECPKCKASAIIKGQEQYGGGWICWAKKGGCGTKYPDADKSITEQKIGRIENPDIMDTVNTVLKMAKKRAKIDAVIGVTRSSGIFTQDLEDVPLPPVKPEVPRTQEDIPLSGPAKPAAADRQPTVKGEAVPEKAAVQDGGSAEGGTVESESLPTGDQTKRTSAPTETIENEKGMIVNFARAFKAGLPLNLQKSDEALRHEWLGLNGYKDADGVPTSKAIPKARFEAVKAEAVAWAMAKAKA